MTGIIKTDQLQGAQSTTVTVPTGNTLAVTSNATVGGTLGVTGTLTTAAITSTGRHDVNFNGAGTQAFKYTDTGGGNLAAFGQFYNTSDALIGNIQNANNDGIHLNIKNGSIVFSNVGYTAANALDDYEEGTFTPRVYDSAGNVMNLATAAGFYTKIGRSVHINFYIVLASSGSTFAGNQIYIDGLPFTNANVSNNVNMHQMVRSNVDSTSGYHEVIAYIDQNRNYYQLLHGGDNVGYDNFRGTALSNSCQLILTAHYFVD